MEFEWDATKARSNIRKHKVAFEEASNSFDDVFALQYLDRTANYEEERFISIGMANGIVYHVTYTERNDRIRLISARRATKAEQRNYDRERYG